VSFHNNLYRATVRNTSYWASERHIPYGTKMLPAT